MTLIELLDIVSKGYPDECTRAFYTNAGEIESEATGDTLAEFIVREIIENFEPDADEVDQINLAVNLLTNASNDIESVVLALHEARA